MRITSLCFAIIAAGWCVESTAQENKPATAAATQPAGWPFAYWKETTYVSKPVRRDGTVDYVAAINQRLSQGVTRENNAAIPLIEAITRGGVAQQAGHYASLREALGMAPLADAPAAAANDPNAPATLPPAQFDSTLRRAWIADDSPDTAKWLETMSAKLDLLVEASKRERYYMPLLRPRDDDFMASILLPHLNEARQLANALKSRAMLRLGTEDVEGFRRDAIAVVRLGRLLTAGPTMIERLVGIAVESTGLETLRIAATGGWLSEAQVQAILGDLRSGPQSRPLHEVFELTERVFLLEFLQYAAVHGQAAAEKMLREMTRPNNAMPVPSVPAVAKDWNAALRKANGWYDRLEDAGKRPTYTAVKEATEQIERDLASVKADQEGLKTLIAPLEDRAIAMLMSSATRAYTVETRARAERTLTEAALALSSFRSASGEYPEELKQLSPLYFKEEPPDPFTEKPLVYVRQGKGYVLRSIAPQTRGRADALVVEVK
jgi:hypothetical protein